MKILLVGYGRMGPEVEKIATERGHTIVGRVDPFSPAADAKVLSAEHISEAELVIEFSLADAVKENALLYASTGARAVVGTTNVAYEKLGLESLFKSSGAYLHGSNFSIGAHAFSAIVEFAANLTRDLEAYDVFMYEIHHRLKQDSPSGTALSIAKKIVATGKKEHIVTERLDRSPETNELHVASVRGGSVPGMHTVMLDSTADTVEIRHTARNRSGFALGAVLAAEWLAGKQGVFSVDDFIGELFEHGGKQ